MSEVMRVSQLKARLSEVIDRIESGESIRITRNGRLVAEIRPIETVSPAQAVQRIRAIRKRVRKRNRDKPPWPPEGKSLRDAAHDGHRF